MSSLATPDETRRLGALIRHVDGEWLPGAFVRVGFELGVPAMELSRWCGLDFAARKVLGERVSLETQQSVSAAFGWSNQQIRASTFESLPKDLIGIAPNWKRTVWARPADLRYCPACLDEQPGVLLSRWQFGWTFLCLRHKIVLRGSCPSCQSAIVLPSASEKHVRDPALCHAVLADGQICRYPLAAAWDEYKVEDDSPLHLTQVAIQGLATAYIQPGDTLSPRNLRAAAVALLSARNFERIASLAGLEVSQLAGLIDETASPELSSPREPLACAAVLSAAYQLVTGDERVVNSIIRQVTFERPLHQRQGLNGPSSASYLLSSWPGIDVAMQGRVLRSLDGDLTPIERLQTGSAASLAIWSRYSTEVESWTSARLEAERMRSSGNTGAISRTPFPRRPFYVPGLLWPEWAAPLGVDTHADEIALRSALSTALQIAVSSSTRKDNEVAKILGKKLKRSLLGQGRQGDSVLRELCNLALRLRVEPGPINYNARRNISAQYLLQDGDWELLCESVGEHPGRGRRVLSARRYAFLRAVPTAPDAMPESLSFRQHGPTITEYRHFTLTMSAELKAAIDAHLRAWLWRFSLPTKHQPAYNNPEDAVITWHPPRRRHDGSALAPELDDIDMATLHEAIAQGVTSVSALADLVDRTPRHVRWAVAENPLPSGASVSWIDWQTAFAKLPRGGAFYIQGAG